VTAREPKELLRRMLEIYSPSGKEGEIAEFLRGQMAELGFGRVWVDSAGNVLGEVGGGPPTVLLCGHMDTVPGRLPVKVENGRLYGRGAVDAKASLAAMTVAASRMAGRAGRGRVLVAGVVEEETESVGVRQLLGDGLEVDWAVFGEPSGVRGITVGYRGRLEVRALCETEPGHAGSPRPFDNAIEKAYGLWTRIRDWASSRRGHPPRSYFYSTSARLTGIRGGEATNVVPARCTLTVDVRLPPAVSCREAVEQLEAIARQYEKENPGLRLSLEFGDRVEPFRAREDSEVVRALRGAIEETVGGPVRLLRKTGTGDMNIFAAETGVPVATYGPGDSQLSHTSREYIEADEYQASIEVYRRAAERLLTLKK